MDIRLSNFIDLNDVMTDMKLSTDNVELPVPHYFRSGDDTERNRRAKDLDAQIAGVASMSSSTKAEEQMTFEQAIRIVQVRGGVGMCGQSRVPFLFVVAKVCVCVSLRVCGRGVCVCVCVVACVCVCV